MQPFTPVKGLQLCQKMFFPAAVVAGSVIAVGAAIATCDDYLKIRIALQSMHGRDQKLRKSAQRFHSAGGITEYTIFGLDDQWVIKRFADQFNSF